VLDLYLDEDLRKKIFEERVSDTIDRIRKRLKIFCDKEFSGDRKLAERVESVKVCEGFPAHGKGLISHAFLGRTTKRVLRRTRKPVFIIPLPKGETDITFHDL